MRNLKSYVPLAGLTLAILSTLPTIAGAQDQPAPADKVATSASATIPKPGGAVSSSYADCVAGQPIAGTVVSSKPKGSILKGACAAPASTPAAGPKTDASASALVDADQRTYTAGRFTDGKIVATPAAGSPCPLPAGARGRQARIGRIVLRNKLAVCEPVAAAAATPPTTASKSISQKGVKRTVATEIAAPPASGKGITEKGIKRSDIAATAPTPAPSTDATPAAPAMTEKTKPVKKGIPTPNGGIITGNGTILSPGK